MSATISSLRTGDRFEGFLRVMSAEVRIGSKGSSFLSMNLADRSGLINCKVWNYSAEAPAAGSVVKVRAGVEEFNGRLQLRPEIWRMATADDQVDESQLPPVFPEGTEEEDTEVRPNSGTVASLQPGMRFEGQLLVRQSAQKEGKNGSRYLDLNLVDKTGEINCKMWNGTVPPPPVSSVVYLRGGVEEFNGRLQLRIDKLETVTDPDKIDMSVLVPSAPDTPAHMRQIIGETVERFASAPLKALVREMLRMAGDSLDWFPAAQRMHHAERSGLLHHTTDMLKTAEYIIAAYPYLNGDLLRAGVILHDLGKIHEMQSDEFGNVSDYSRDGLLVGHLVRGVSMLDEAARNVGVSGELVALLEHMMISHHGIPEYGSPRMPMFPEAEALHWIDTLDARMNELQGIQERTPAGAFSERIPSLDNRRMYHPFYTDEAE